MVYVSLYIIDLKPVALAARSPRSSIVTVAMGICYSLHHIRHVYLEKSRVHACCFRDLFQSLGLQLRVKL